MTTVLAETIPAAALRAVPAPAVPFALTSDELRALSRLTGAPLSGLFLDEDGAYDPADEAVADAVAVRSLAARGLVTVGDDVLGTDAVRATPAASAALGAVLAPVALVEVEADRAGSPWIERHVVAWRRSGDTTVLTETVADVWEVAAGPPDLAAAVRVVTGLGIPAEGPDPRAAAGRAGRSIVVPVEVHDLADSAFEGAGAEAAAAVLVAGGADATAAEAWAAAVEGRAASLEVRAARLPDGMADGIDAGSVRLLLGGPLGTWVFDTEEGDGDEADGDGHGDRSRMTEVPAAEAAALVDSLCGPLSRSHQ